MAVNSLAAFEVESGVMAIKINLDNYNVFKDLPRSLVLEALEELFNCLDEGSQEAWLSQKYRKLREVERLAAIESLESGSV